MADNSAIEWTDGTWNPVTGCRKISPGCKHCYAERLAERLHAMGNSRYRNGFELTLHRDQVSVTGCFNKGTDADHYVLKDEKGKDYIVTGDAAMLARHANNHRVTITGNMTKEKDKDVLKATNLQMLAVCQ